MVQAQMFLLLRIFALLTSHPSLLTPHFSPLTSHPSLLTPNYYRKERYYADQNTERSAGDQNTRK